MLSIRAEQLDFIRTAVLQSFKSKMVEHLCSLRIVPSCRRSREQVISLVEVGVVRAFERGFRLEGPVRLYLELMFVFGELFDSDPSLPWAAEILHCRSGLSELDCANLLYRAAENHLAQEVGHGA